MANFSRLEVLNEIISIGLVPVFYHPKLDVAKQIVEACRLGGARVVEFTNRGDNAYRIFSDLTEYYSKVDPTIVLGVGSVIDPFTAAIYVASGANFVVGSVLNPDVAKLCNRHKISYSPGCGTAGEISQAEELGVEIVKIFPGDTVGGPAFVKAVLGPTPWTRIMPTGGIDTTEESVTSWIRAGAAAIGIGSKLIKKELVEAEDYNAIATMASRVISWIQVARGKSVFLGFRHFGLSPRNGASAREVSKWYEELFEFEIHEKGSGYVIEGPEHERLEILESGAKEPCHITIVVSDFEEAITALRAKGIEFGESDLRSDSKTVTLKQVDPAGNRVHLLWKI